MNIDETQFGFVPSGGTLDAIFINYQLQEKYIAVKKPLYFAFVDLEKALDRVPSKFLWWALRSLGVEEWAVRVIQGMCIRVLSLAHCSSSWCWRCCHVSSTPWELLYADDLMLITDTQEECISKLKAWKAGMESKGLRINITEFEIIDSKNSSTAYVILYELIDLWVLDWNRRVGVWLLPWCWQILSILLIAGQGISAKTCGLDDVLPPDDLRSHPETLC